MKTQWSLLLFCLLLAVSCLGQPSEARGPNHRFYPPGERVVLRGQSNAALSEGIVAIESGMNYWDKSQKAWLPSEAKFEPTEDGFVTRKHQCGIWLSAQLNCIGAINVTLASGTKISSTPVGIALSDAVSGSFLVVAGLTNSVGVQIAENQVLYPNAFQAPGVCASMLVTIEKGTVAVDTIFEGKLDPAEWGFPRETTRIQILTEFYGAPEPERIRQPVYIESDERVRAKMAIPDLMDETLGFSEFVLGTGHAFTTPSDLAPEGTASVVAKEYVEMGDGGRVFLVETVPYAWLAKGFESLGACTPVTGSFKPQSSREKAYAALPRPPQVAQAERARPASKELAASLRKPRGVVIDYLATISGTLSAPIVFSSYTNWVVVGPVICNSAAVIDGGCIFKFPTNANCYLQFNSTVTCKSGSRPIVFTGVDDDRLGESCVSVTNVGYTGVIDPTGYANPAVKMGQASLTLDNVRFCYAKRAIQYQGSPGTVSVTVNHSQFVKCIRGVDLTVSGTGGTGTLSVKLNNSLMSQTTYPLSFAAQALPVTVSVVQSTVDQGTKLLDGSWTGTMTVASTNSIYANLSNSSSGTFYGNANGFYNVAQTFGVSQLVSSSSPFTSVGAGNYYLTDASGFRNQGTNVLAAWLSADLKKRTTYPPLVVSATTYTNNQVLWPQAQRDTDTLDLGVHYQPIDYAFNGVDVTNATLVLTNGVSVALFSTTNGANYGLGIRSLGVFSSVGLPNNQNRLVQFNTVQEQPASTWLRTPSGLLVSEYQSTGSAPSINCRFTAFASLGLDAPLFYGATNQGPFYFRDCEFFGGKVVSVRPSLVFTNCLFEKVYAEVKPADGQTSSFRNNLFVGGAFTSAATSQFLRDNVFDQTWITNTSTYTGGTNAYVTGYQRLSPTTAGDILLTNSPAYQTGPLGNYYQPTNSVLINADTTTWATNVGMYHYTVSTNTVAGLQVKEGGTLLDAGYHYVATDLSGNPIDSDADGWSDVFEDTNGNGTVDSGETDWQKYNSPNGLPSGSGLQVFTPLK